MEPLGAVGRTPLESLQSLIIERIIRMISLYDIEAVMVVANQLSAS